MLKFYIFIDIQLKLGRKEMEIKVKYPTPENFAKFGTIVVSLFKKNLLPPFQKTIITDTM
jgi:hypothetical protein